MRTKSNPSFLVFGDSTVGVSLTVTPPRKKNTPIGVEIFPIGCGLIRSIYLSQKNHKVELVTHASSLTEYLQGLVTKEPNLNLHCQEAEREIDNLAIWIGQRKQFPPRGGYKGSPFLSLRSMPDDLIKRTNIVCINTALSFTPKSRGRGDGGTNINSSLDAGYNNMVDSLRELSKELEQKRVSIDFRWDNNFPPALFDSNFERQLIEILSPFTDVLFVTMGTIQRLFPNDALSSIDHLSRKAGKGQVSVELASFFDRFPLICVGGGMSLPKGIYMVKAKDRITTITTPWKKEYKLPAYIINDIALTTDLMINYYKGMHEDDIIASADEFYEIFNSLEFSESLSTHLL